MQRFIAGLALSAEHSDNPRYRRDDRRGKAEEESRRTGESASHMSQEYHPQGVLYHIRTRRNPGGSRKTTGEMV